MMPIQKLFNDRHKKKRKKENGVELEMHSILKKQYPKEWSFVGDGKFKVGGKKPDFVNKKKKLIIEVFGEYWHASENPDDRITFFEALGYRTMIIWEHEFKNENKIRERLMRFVGK